MNDWAEFRHFKYLLAIAEHKGFRAAAEYLHTAQPNLSAQAKQFQDLSDVHLFRKGKDGRIRLTATGVAFKSNRRSEELPVPGALLEFSAACRSQLIVFLERDLPDSARSQELDLILIFGGISQSW